MSQLSRLEERRSACIDQRKLPFEEIWFVCGNIEDVWYAIREMVVRSAPAIGATAVVCGSFLSH